MSNAEHVQSGAVAWLGTPRSARILQVVLRLFGVVVLLAVVSLWVQLEGLVGSHGVSPAVDYALLVQDQLGATAYARLPSLFWLAPSDGMLHGLAAAAAVASVLIIANRAVGPSLVVVWACYLSLSMAGQRFLSFQWDILLLEVAFVLLLVAPWRWRGRAGVEPSRWGVWALRLVGVKLMIASGYVKLASGDPVWADLTALTYHYQTQPIPNPIAWFAHQLPEAVHGLSAAVMFAIELVLPLGVFFGRTGRLVAVGGCLALLAGLFVTGNYGFFQPLSAVLVLAWLDDTDVQAVSAWLRRRSPEALPAPAGVLSRPGFWAARVGATVLVGLSAAGVVEQVRGETLPGVAGAVTDAVRPFRTVNRYGLFAVMTTERPELELQGTRDGEVWQSYTLRYKPGPTDRMPPVLGPHMPRLDWQMWFAALGSCRGNPWLVDLMGGVLEGREPVLELFDHDPFGGEAPLGVRVVRWDYRFTELGESGWWVRSEPGLHCPAVSLAPMEGD